MNTSKTMMIVGFGPGNSTAVAEKFGAEGFSLALVGRDEERLASGVSSLRGRGIRATAFPGDAGPASIGATIRNVRAQLGPITAIHWNAYGATDVGDLLTADPAALSHMFDVAVLGLLAAVREALPDLKSAGNGAVLITNGGFGDLSPQMDEYATTAGVMGIALSNAAKNKLAGLLSQRLKRDGVYVGEVMIYGTVKGTPTASGNAIDPSVTANKFWELYRARSDVRAEIR